MEGELSKSFLAKENKVSDFLDRKKEVMECLLEGVEAIYLQNQHADADSLLRLVKLYLKDKGHELSPGQEKFVKKKTDLFVKDIARSVEIFRSIFSDLVDREDVDKSDERSEVVKLNPWLLLETDENLQRRFLEFLPTKSKDPKDFGFITSNPPFIVIKCNPENFGEIIHATNRTKKSIPDGNVPIPFPFVSDKKNDVSFLRDKIAIVCDSVGQGTVTHELQHLFFHSYFEGHDPTEVQAINELTAYLKGGDSHFDDGGIFSDINDDIDLFIETSKLEWTRVKEELNRLSGYGVDLNKLWSKVAVCKNLTEVADYLSRVQVDPENFTLSLRNFSWYVDNYENLSSVERLKSKSFDVANGISHFLLTRVFFKIKDVKDIVLSLETSGQEIEFLKAFSQLLKQMITTLENIISIYPDYSNAKFIPNTAHVYKEAFDENEHLDRLEEWRENYVKDFNGIVNYFLQKSKNEITDFEVPSFSGGFETVSELLEQLRKIEKMTELRRRETEVGANFEDFGINDDNINEVSEQIVGLSSLGVKNKEELLKIYEYIIFILKEKRTFLNYSFMQLREIEYKLIEQGKLQYEKRESDKIKYSTTWDQIDATQEKINQALSKMKEL